MGGRNIFIYDMGGGTFDDSLFTNNDGILEVKAIACDTTLAARASTTVSSI